jgi:uncharacterized membrane protein YjjB (DUF3815 family)
MNISKIGIVLVKLSEENLFHYVASIFVHVNLYVFFSMHSKQYAFSAFDHVLNYFIYFLCGSDVS